MEKPSFLCVSDGGPSHCGGTLHGTSDFTQLLRHSTQAEERRARGKASTCGELGEGVGGGVWWWWWGIQLMRWVCVPPLQNLMGAVFINAEPK